MQIRINGQLKTFTGGLTLTQLVEQLGMKPDRIAVELNLAIAPRTEWAGIILKDGDSLEIVHFVGGGLR